MDLSEGGRIILEYGSAEKTHGNRGSRGSRYGDGGDVSNITSSDTRRSYVKKEDEGKLGKLSNSREGWAKASPRA